MLVQQYALMLWLTLEVPNWFSQSQKRHLTGLCPQVHKVRSKYGSIFRNKEYIGKCMSQKENTQFQELMLDRTA